ncbi:MAG TPA: FAD-dependent oxidoreductase [Dongiaceae bacterium]
MTRPVARVVIAGAGVAGLTCALALAKRGCHVEVFERSATLAGDACSRLAGGMLAPWCELENAEPMVATLGVEAIAYWRAQHPGTIQKGSLVLAQTRDLPELDRFARRASHFERVDGDRIAALEPALAGRFRQGLFFPQEAHLDPRQALPSLAQRLQEQGGKILLGNEIHVTQPPPAGADLLIDCRGLAARDRLPDLRGVKGEMAMIRSAEISLTRPVRLLHPRLPFYVVPRGGGLYMLGATMVESDDRHRVTVQSLVELLNAAYALHPAFAQAQIVEIGGDARPAFSDNLPRIRRRGTTISVNGLFRHGFLLAPALARLATDVALDNAFYPEVMDEDHA